MWWLMLMPLFFMVVAWIIMEITYAKAMSILISGQDKEEQE